MIKTIYRIQSYKGIHQGVYITPLTLEEKKEEIVSQLIEKGIPKFLLEDFKVKEEDSFELISLEEIEVNENNNEINNEIYKKFISYKKKYIQIRLDQIENGKNLFRPIKRLVFTDGWTKFARPSLCSTTVNPVLKNIADKLKVEHTESVDIIKLLSLFIIENMKENEATRIPYIGSFKIKRNKIVNLKGIEYGAVCVRRRIGRSEPEQNLD